MSEVMTDATYNATPEGTLQRTATDFERKIAHTMLKIWAADPQWEWECVIDDTRENITSPYCLHTCEYVLRSNDVAVLGSRIHIGRSTAKPLFVTVSNENPARAVTVGPVNLQHVGHLAGGNMSWIVDCPPGCDTLADVIAQVIETRDAETSKFMYDSPAISSAIVAEVRRMFGSVEL